MPGVKVFGTRHDRKGKGAPPQAGTKMVLSKRFLEPGLAAADRMSYDPSQPIAPPGFQLPGALAVHLFPYNGLIDLDARQPAGLS